MPDLSYIKLRNIDLWKAAVDDDGVTQRSRNIDSLKSIHTEGTASAGTSTETTIFEITATLAELKGFILNLKNLTAGATIKIYMKEDGTNYDAFDTIDWSVTDEDIVIYHSFVFVNAIKVTITGNEASAVNINYHAIYNNLVT